MHTRRISLLILALVCAVIFQTTIGAKFTLFGARPDLVLLVVVVNSVVRGVEEGLLGGIMAGLMVDTMSAVPFGSATLGMGLIGLAMGLGEANLYRTNLLVPLVVVFLATILYHSFLMLVLQGSGWTVDWISTLALQTVPGALFNALLAPLAFPLVRKMGADSQERLRW